MNIFEISVRNKFRFPFKGLISAEDLWDLSLEDLDHIFKTLNSELKAKKEESLLDDKSAEDKMLETKIEIIKHIVKVKKSEKKARMKAKEDKAKRQRIMEIIKTKKDESLKDKSIDDLQGMLDELGD